MGEQKIFSGSVEALHNAVKAARVVRLQVVHHQVVDARGAAAGLGDGANELLIEVALHRVEQGDFLVQHQKGVVGGAARRKGIAVEVPAVPVNGADPENIFFDFNRLHVQSPFRG